jgi:hypothetical protein
MDKSHSDFWLDEYVDDIYISSNNSDLIKLSSYRRAISNFVQILTNKSIPVEFNVVGDNSTDGKTVHLSAKLQKKEDFDVAVGLSLHEGSHILLTDFDVLKTVWQKIPRDIFELSKKNNINSQKVIDLSHLMFNYVEDRYIDQFVYSTAIGYAPYYLSLYDRYFNSEKLTEILKSNMYRNPTIDSYVFRIINLINVDSQLDALNGLSEIYSIIDYDNILRLKKTTDRLHVAFDIVRIIIKNVVNDSQKSSSLDDDDSKVMVGNETSTDVDLNVDNNTSVPNSIFKKQKDFINGRINKKSISADDFKTMDAIEKNNMISIIVGKQFGKPSFSGIECIVVKKLTRDFLFDKNFPLKSTSEKFVDVTMESVITNGLLLGKKLANKLQMRNDVRSTKYTRKSSGKIDKRILNEIGFENENIFFRSECERYEDSHIHISVDASKSMEGIKWTKTITLLVTICKAASILKNIRVTVSFRTSQCGKKSYSVPYVIMAYDSKIDPFKKVIEYFKYLTPNNTTPEGLAFEAIIENLPTVILNEKHYFLNISDGEPFFVSNMDTGDINYSETPAAIHTKCQIKKIISSGYKVLSYFIQNNTDEHAEDLFKQMYGKHANFIDVQDISKIAKTLNGIFLKKTS